MNKEKISYESVLVSKPDWDLAGQKKFFQKIQEVIKQFQGEIHHIDSWGTRRLANQNKKRWPQGLYFHFSFNAQAGIVAELARQIRMNDHFVYHHFEKLSSKQSLSEHLKAFRSTIEESIDMEKERQVRIQKRKNFLIRNHQGA